MSRNKEVASVSHSLIQEHLIHPIKHGDKKHYLGFTGTDLLGALTTEVREEFLETFDIPQFKKFWKLYKHRNKHLKQPPCKMTSPNNKTSQPKGELSPGLAYVGSVVKDVADKNLEGTKALIDSTNAKNHAAAQEAIGSTVKANNMNVDNFMKMYQTVRTPQKKKLTFEDVLDQPLLDEDDSDEDEFQDCKENESPSPQKPAAKKSAAKSVPASKTNAPPRKKPATKSAVRASMMKASPKKPAVSKTAQVSKAKAAASKAKASSKKTSAGDGAKKTVTSQAPPTRLTRSRRAGVNPVRTVYYLSRIIERCS